MRVATGRRAGRQAASKTLGGPAPADAGHALRCTGRVTGMLTQEHSVTSMARAALSVVAVAILLAGVASIAVIAGSAGTDPNLEVGIRLATFIGALLVFAHCTYRHISRDWG